MQWLRTWRDPSFEVCDGIQLAWNIQPNSIDDKHGLFETRVHLRQSMRCGGGILLPSKDYVGHNMGWFSILPADYVAVESWIASLFVSPYCLRSS